MTKVRKRLLIALSLLALIMPSQVMAGSVGDFFKALGNSIAHPGQHPKPRPRDSKTTSKPRKDKTIAPDYPPAPSPTPIATPTPTPSQPSVRAASAPTQKKDSKRDIPYGIPVPNRPGFVTSPFSPKAGYVDVRGFPSGTEVKDPYSGKVFLTP